MNILIIQENGRHSQNREFRECHNIKRAFDRMGINSTIWGLGHENFNDNFSDLVKNHDVIFVLENYEVDNWIPDLSNLNKLKLFWSIDSHCNPQGNIHTAKKHKVDIVLNSIESDQVLFENSKTFYFPNVCPIDLVYPMETIKKVNFIGFCGTPFPYRLSTFDLIEKELGFEIKKDFWALGKSMVEAVNSYFIHFNKSSGKDINWRVLETMATKTLLVTSNNENVRTHFKDMEEIVVYDSDDSMIEKLKYLYDNQHLIDDISKKGYLNVINNHSYDVRLGQLIKIIDENI